MNNTFNTHIPVLLQEAISALVTTPDGLYVDATFGRGNHTRAILQALSDQGTVIAFDKDPSAIHYGRTTFNDERLSFIHASFEDLLAQLSERHLVGQVNGVLFDLGVSSPQLDDPARGFSFMQDGPLDMRMDTTQGLSASAWLSQVAEETLAKVLWEYGEEKFSRRIAHAIIIERDRGSIDTTGQLAAIIKAVVPPSREVKHPATRSFQAIRIFINQELTALKAALVQAYQALAVGGRLAVISFHSLEDRIVKQFIKQHTQGEVLPRKLPIKHRDNVATLQAVGKAIKPSSIEITTNPRARSAILRIAEKRS